MGIEVLLDKREYDSYSGSDELQVGKDEEGKFWFRTGSFNSCFSIVDNEWEPWNVEEFKRQLGQLTTFDAADRAVILMEAVRLVGI